MTVAELPHVDKGQDPAKPTPQPETFIVFDAIFQPHIMNIVTRGSSIGVSGRSFAVHGAAEFTLVGAPLDFELRYQRYNYRSLQSYSSIDSSLSAKVGMQVHPEKIYAGLGYIGFADNYGFPALGGLGVGLTKLPVLERKLSFSGNFWFYPHVRGLCGVRVCTNGATMFAYRAMEYGLGATYGLGSRFFLNAEYTGDRLSAKTGSPIGPTYSGGQAGLGLHL
jgi:hypothetical protein